jgi:hypothetical protein
VLVDDDRRDEVTADHEKHIDADEAPAGHRQPRVKEDDGQDGDGAQSVDFGAVSHQTQRAVDSSYRD